MVFKISRKSLQNELALLIQIAGQKNVIPALETIRFEVRESAEAASLLASSGDMALFTEVAAIGDDWKGCIPARQLHDLVRLASNCEEITFTPQGGLMQIAWGRSRHRLPVINFSAFPDVSGCAADKNPVTVKVDDFTAALERVLPCAERADNSKWMVRGIKLEADDGQLKVIGTNTHRLGVAAIPCDGQIDLFVPLKAAELLPRMKSEEVAIWQSGNHAIFSYGPRTLKAGLPTGTFPNWQAFMPSYLPLSASFSTEEMVGALKRAEVTRDETFKTGVGLLKLGVVLVFGKEELLIDTKHSDVHGRSEESVMVQSNLNGDLIYMGINPDYVADFLKHAGATTEVFLKDARSVVKFTDGSSFEYVVLPLRV